MDARLSETEAGAEPQEGDKAEERLQEAEEAEEKAGEDLEKGDVGQGVVWVGWDGPEDPENPMLWSKGKKWTASLLGIGFTCLCSANVSAYSISQPSMMRELHVATHTVVIGLTVWTLGFGCAPLVLAPASEVYGRKPVYVIAGCLYSLMYLAMALTPTFAGMLVARAFSGICASTAIAVVGGTLSDVWTARERSLPMALFAWAAFSFTGLGATVFGYVEMVWGFRVINMTLFIVSAIFSVALTLFIKESRASVLLSRKAARLRRETGSDRYQCKTDAERASVRVLVKTSLLRPLRMLFTEPVVGLFSVYLAFLWGCLYGLLESIPYVYRTVYHFNTGEQGLVFIVQVVGATMGLAVGRRCDQAYVRNFDKHGPEGRIYAAMVGGVLVPIGGWLFAWLSREEVFWLVPCLCITLVFCGMSVVYLAVFNYLADSYRLFAASAISGQSCLRNVFGAVFPLFSNQMYETLGIGGAGSLMAGLATLLAFIPFLLFKHGAEIRARSPMAKQLAALDQHK